VIPTTPRPQRPYEDPAWSTYDSEERGRRNMAWRLALTDWWIEGNGLRRVDAHTEGARQCCTECLAGGIPNGEPPRGPDSHGDCAEDGEPLWWVVRAKPLPPVDRGEEAALFLLRMSLPDDASEPLFEDQLRVIADDETREGVFRQAQGRHFDDRFITDHLEKALHVLRANAKARRGS